jgi:hypothetical protein
MLLQKRDIGFEEIITAVDNGNLLEVIDHYNSKKHPTQKIMFVRILFEVYVVPFVIEEDGTFLLKTCFPSRKARKTFLGI